jgi:hypothetical protein
MPVGRANAVVDDLVSLAMEDGFEKCLVELAKSHENKTGAWLENIETEVLQTLKERIARDDSGCRAGRSSGLYRSASDGGVLQGIPR